MEILFAVILFGVFAFFVGKFVKHKSLYPFMPFQYDFRKRRNTFKKVLELLKKTNAKTIVETGTSREGLQGAKSNGAATIVFGKWAIENNAFLHSVDISEKSIAAAQKEVDKQKLGSSVKIHLSDSVAFLANFKTPVDMLYLDSYDYGADLEVQKKSQLHHLAEFKAIEKALHSKTIVLIDDCDLPNGGKGKLVVEYMLQRNWEIVMNNYQILLLHKDFGI